MKNNLLEQQTGMTLIEILVAAVLLAGVILAFAYAFVSGRAFLGNSDVRRQAVVLAQARLEQLKSQFPVAEQFVLAPAEEDPVADYPSYRRITQAIYVLDDNFSVESPDPTNTLLVTVRVEPATGANVDFPPVELYCVVAR